MENVRRAPHPCKGKKEDKVVCTFDEKTLIHLGWLNAEAAALAERHIYSTFTLATRESLLNARFTQGPLSAEPIVFMQGQCERN